MLLAFALDVALDAAGRDSISKRQQRQRRHAFSPQLLITMATHLRVHVQEHCDWHIYHGCHGEVFL